MKKILIVLLALSLVFALAACGGGDAPADTPAVDPADTPADAPTVPDSGKPATLSSLRVIKLWGDELNASKHPVWIKYSSEMDMGNGPEELTILTAYKNDWVYSDTESPTSGHTSNLLKEDTTYVIMHDEKMYMEMDMAMDTPALNDGQGGELTETDITTGEEEMNGIPCEWEEFATEDGICRFYFEKGSGDWKFWQVSGEGEVVVMEVLGYGSDVKDSWFELPADYQSFSY